MKLLNVLNELTAFMHIHKLLIKIKYTYNNFGRVNNRKL